MISQTRFVAAIVGAALLVAPGQSLALSDFSPKVELLLADNQSCMTSRMLRDYLAKVGYTQVFLDAPTGRIWEAKATNKNKQVVRLQVDTCRSRIISERPVGQN